MLHLPPSFTTVVDIWYVIGAHFDCGLRNFSLFQIRGISGIDRDIVKALDRICCEIYRCSAIFSHAQLMFSLDDT